jgi:hypothetical protein
VLELLGKHHDDILDGYAYMYRSDPYVLHLDRVVIDPGYPVLLRDRDGKPVAIQLRAWKGEAACVVGCGNQPTDRLSYGNQSEPALAPNETFPRRNAPIKGLRLFVENFWERHVTHCHCHEGAVTIDTELHMNPTYIGQAQNILKQTMPRAAGVSLPGFPPGSLDVSYEGLAWSVTWTAAGDRIFNLDPPEWYSESPEDHAFSSDDGSERVLCGTCAGSPAAEVARALANGTPLPPAFAESVRLVRMLGMPVGWVPPQPHYDYLAGWTPDKKKNWAPGKKEEEERYDPWDAYDPYEE